MGAKRETLVARIRRDGSHLSAVPIPDPHSSAASEVVGEVACDELVLQGCPFVEQALHARPSLSAEDFEVRQDGGRSWPSPDEALRASERLRKFLPVDGGALDVDDQA